MKIILSALVLACCTSGFAKGYSPAVTARAGGYDVKFASNGTAIATPVSALPGGGIGATTNHTVQLPGGVGLPTVLTSALAAGAMLSPWGSAIGLALTAGTIGVAVLDAAMSDAKVRIAAGVLQRSDPNACTVATGCNEIRYNTGAWSMNDATACRSGIASLGGTATRTYWKNENQLCYYNFIFNGEAGSAYIEQQRRTVPAVADAYINATVPEAVAAITARSPTVAEVQALVDLNFPPVLELPVITGPASVFKGNVVMLGLDGTVTEIEERYIASFNPGVIGIGVQTKQTVTTPQKVATTTTTNPDGSQSTAVTTTPKTSSTISTSIPLPVEKPEIVTCGLPGTPACKMDETGTAKDSGTVFDKTKTDIDTAKTSAEKNITDAASIAAPTWSFAFQLPTGCAPYVTGIKGVILNVCQYQSTIHGLLSAIWAAATAFAMIGMVGRTIREA